MEFEPLIVGKGLQESGDVFEELAVRIRHVCAGDESDNRARPLVYDALIVA
jgi:hypothetical protein